MLRIRHGWLVALLAVSVITACKKDDKSDIAAAVGGPGGAGGGKAASSGDDLSLLPVDAELVVGINVGQIQQSALWKEIAEPALAKARDQHKMGKLNDVKEKCGFDPSTAIKSIAIGLKGFAAEKPDGVVVVHGLDKTKTLACTDKMKDEITAEGSEITHDGDVTLVKNKQGETVAIAFANDSTMVMVIGANATTAGIKTVLAGGSALKTSPAFVEMYGKVKTTDSVWVLGSGGLMDKAAAVGAKPKGMFGSLNVTDGLALDASLKFETPDAAAQVASKLKQQSQMAVTMVDKIDVTSEGDLAKISVVLSNQKLQALISQVGAMFGLGGMTGK